MTFDLDIWNAGSTRTRLGQARRTRSKVKVRGQRFSTADACADVCHECTSRSDAFPLFVKFSVLSWPAPPTVLLAVITVDHNINTVRLIKDEAHAFRRPKTQM